jgi:RNA polymerase sigma factor (sigma-70 family)
MKTNENELRMKNEELAKLAAKAKTGDQAAFTELYNRTSNDLFRCIRAMTRDEDLTWDIQQDSYLRAFQSLDKLENNEAFFPWLRRIAVNVTADRMKQRLPLTFTELTVEDDDGMPELPDLNPANQPELSLDRKETSRLVQEILSKLPEEQQLIVGMRYYDELSVKEIAGLLNISDGAVKAQLFHGRKKVETAVRALEKQGIKLYGLSPVAFLVALMRQAEPTAASGTRLAAVKAAVAKASADAVAATAVPVAAKTFGQVLAGRVLAGALAVALIGGGIWGGAKLLKSKQRYNPYQPTTVVTSERLAGVETPEELTETGEALPVVTEPVVTEPTATEAVTAEPAQPVRADNQCGEHLTWGFFPDYSGLLRIQGNGDMYDFVNAEDIPWYSIRNEIQQVELPDNLTSIGDYAFAGCKNLNSCHYYDTAVTRIGNSAFEGCTNFTIVLPATLTSVGDRAFAGCVEARRLILPAALREISSTAFQGCDKLSLIFCSKEVTALDLDAFVECAGLREIWVLNTEAAIRGSLADGAQVTVCGLPGSTAEQYAAENGLDFDPMEDDRDEIIALMKQGSSYEQEDETGSPVTVYHNRSLHYNGVVKVGDRYVSQILRFVPYSVPEEEIRQARESRSIVLQGEEYEYTESKDQAKEWFRGDWSEPEGFHVVGYVMKVDRSNSNSYASADYFVCQQDDGYCFYTVWWNSSVSQYSGEYLYSYEPVGWLWMDADSPYSENGDLSTTIERRECSPGIVVYPDQLELRGTELILYWAAAGR